jgi:hypothetical protein
MYKPFETNYKPVMESREYWERPYVMVLDTQKANLIIKEKSREKKIKKAYIGLDGDFKNNHQEYYKHGKVLGVRDMHTYSIWAVPILILHYEKGANEAYFVYEKEFDLSEQYLSTLKPTRAGLDCKNKQKW